VVRTGTAERHDVHEEVSLGSGLRRVVPLAIVGDALANRAGNGGGAWVRVSYVLGLRRLGFDVVFVEQVARTSCNAASVRFFSEVAETFGFGESAALIDDDGVEIVPLRGRDLLEVAENADLLLNVSGNLRWRPLRRRVRRTVYLDLDPGFTQAWYASGAIRDRLEGHDVYFTIGENIGAPFCPIPTGGIDWRTTRPFATLGEWPVARECERDLLTTVGSWRGPYGPVRIDKLTYGVKAHAFRKVIELPGRARQRFQLALRIHPDERADLDLLRRHGWELVDPEEVASDPDSFRRYVQGSGGEFSAAQEVYAETESGWLSDRTVRYLASGKPALVQETGFSRNIPSGEGLVPYRILADAVAGAAAIAAGYERHCEAARALAEEHFDSDMVLSRLLDHAGVG
jgi:hypothetical protein